MAALLAAAVVASAVPTAPGAGAAPAPPAGGRYVGYLDVSPYPNSKFVEPGVQVSVLGAPMWDLGSWTFTGSKSGAHAGAFHAYSQGDGASFVFTHPFTPGEVVTVHTNMDVAGVTGHTYTFTIATPVAVIAGVHPAGAGVTPVPAARRSGGRPATSHFRSEPSLKPPVLTVTTDKPGVAPGDIFLDPVGAGVENGPMIATPSGKVVWFDPLKDPAFNFREQSYEGKAVLTFWQGKLGFGHGFGAYHVLNTSYRQIAVVRAGNGLSGDLHEFVLNANGTALFTAYFPIRETIRTPTGPQDAAVYDGIVQEVDVKTGLVRFEWDSLDHVPIAQSYSPYSPPTKQLPAYDYFHVNSARISPNGDLLISARNTHAVYLVNPNTGKTVWQLGGTKSTWHMGPGTAFAWQHDAELHPDGDVTIFDDEASPAVGPQSRGITIHLSASGMKATLVRQYTHSPKLLSGSQGNVQLLPGGNVMIGWGAVGYASEYNSKGGLLWDSHLPAGVDSYRDFQAPWVGTPASRPALRVLRSGGTLRAFASWNGATKVARWRILAGASGSSLGVVGSGAAGDFETAIDVATTEPVIEAQALDAHGRVLATSAPAR